MNWHDVKPLIEKIQSSLADTDVIIYEPCNSKKATSSPIVPNMTPGRAVLVELIHRYLKGLLDPIFITLLEVHKLMYFMQEAGEPLKLNYKKETYGPYAENLRHVLKAIEGHLISGYADGGDTPSKPLELIPSAIESASSFLKNHPITCARFDRVVKLVSGFESSFGLELLSTVHLIVKHDAVRSAEDVVERAYAWNNRKKQFSANQISIALNTLAEQGWIEHPLI